MLPFIVLLVEIIFANIQQNHYFIHLKITDICHHFVILYHISLTLVRLTHAMPVHRLTDDCTTDQCSVVQQPLHSLGTIICSGSWRHQIYWFYFQIMGIRHVHPPNHCQL